MKRSHFIRLTAHCISAHYFTSPKAVFHIFTLSLLCYAQTAFSWGQKGHDTVCAIAQNHLSKKAQEQISDMLDGKSIVYWANWLDNASNTPDYAYSKTWHYRNTDADQTFESAPLNENGDIVRALDSEIEVLKNTKASHEDRLLALKMVIHLMGDLHQPLHMGHKSDLGGNRWKVNYFRNPTNIHSVWDSQLVESAHKWSHTEWVEELDRLSQTDIAQIQQGTPEDWAKQTYQLCIEVYNATPEDSNLSYDYVSRWTPVVEQQFLRAGYRLAYVLNTVFK